MMDGADDLSRAEDTAGLVPATANDAAVPGATESGAVAEKSQASSAARSDDGPEAAVGSMATVSSAEFNPADPMNFGRHRRENVTQRQMKVDHPKGNKKALKKFYTRQNELIDQFLGADDEERLQVEEDARVAPKIKFAVNASFIVNFCLFVIQLYAAVSTGSLSVNEPGCAISHVYRIDHLHIALCHGRRCLC